MLEIYCLNINEAISDETFNELKRNISFERLNKVDALYFEADKKRSVYGESLVRYLARKYNRLDLEQQIVFKYNKFGKPYFESGSSYYFNLAHSGDWLVCAWSSKEVGIDIEQVTPDNFDMDVVRHFFSQGEYQKINSQKNKNNQICLFYEYWTLKESYLKLLGKGLSIDLKTISFSKPINLLNQEQGIVKFYQKLLDENHQLALCSYYQYCSEIIYLNINEIVKN